MSEANENQDHSTEADEPKEACPFQGVLAAAATAIASLNRRPCLVLARSQIQRTDMELIYQALNDFHGPGIDVLLSSCGGSVEGAYMIARSLRRRFGHVRIYVPHLAKSAATLLSLVADEIVMGPLGELGPMDVQSTLALSAPVSSDASALLPFSGLKTLDSALRDQLRETTEALARATGVRPADIVGHSIDLIAKVYSPIYARVDPVRIGEGSRGLRMGFEYGMRILCRMRGMSSEHAAKIVGKLVHAYPSHDFVIDGEEAMGIGLPVRRANEQELPLMRDLGRFLLGMDLERDVVELMLPGEPDDTGVGTDGHPNTHEAAAAADEEGEAAEAAAPGNDAAQEPTGGEPARACEHAEIEA